MSTNTSTTSVSISVSTAAAAPPVTTTITSTSTSINNTALYGVAAVAVIFIIATGYLAMRGRKPAS